MADYFCESTDVGKLYINYPMVEAFYHMGSIPDPGFMERIATLEELQNRAYEKQQAVIKKEEPPKKTKSAEITEKEEIKNLDKDNKKPATSKKEVISKDTSEKKEAKPEEPKPEEAKPEEAKPEEEIEESIDPAKIRAIPDAKGVNIVNESSGEDWEDITVTFNTNRTSYKVKIDYLAKGQSYYVLNASLQAADGTYFDNGLETFQNMSTYIRISHGKNKIYYDTYL